MSEGDTDFEMTLTKLIRRKTAGGGGAVLTVTAGPDKGLWTEVGSSLVIGSLKESGLALKDPTVSRTHAEISRTAEGYLLQDLGSTNGTFLNGTRVDRAYLREGAVLTMGGTEVTFRSAGSRPAAPAISIFGEMVAVSNGMLRAFTLLEGLAASQVTVLIEGETGTGKELAARAIHERSPRAGGPFVVFDCSTVPADLMESELFGHSRGAFTGATESRKGAVEEAGGGTLFLDEIGDLPETLQPKLLRLLDRREFRRLGTNETLRSDLRFVTATNRDLRSLVKRERFRRDLFYRVSASRVVLPPLRQRPEDIPLLADHFLERINRGSRGRVTLAPDAMEALKGHDWPGNVREMKNLLETAAALCGEGRIRASDLDPLFLELDLTRSGNLQAAEAEAVRRALERAAGNRRKAARLLGIAPSTLYAKMKKYRLG